MAEIAQDREAKATERERKFQGDSSESFRVKEKVRNCTNFVIFFLVMLFSCFGSSENVGMMRLSLPDEL